MAHFDLGYAEAPPMGHDRHETMKFSVELEMGILNQFATIGFEAIVDIMQVNTGQGADQAVEDTRREGFCDGVEAREFPAWDEIIAFIELLQETRDLFRIVL